MRDINYSILAVTIFVMTQFCFAGAKIQLSSTKIPKGKSVRIKIIAEGKNVTFPKITKIAGYSVEKLKADKKPARVIDGKIISKEKKILSFEIYPDKNITIPSFKVISDGREYKTQPGRIAVVDSITDTGGQNIASSIKMKINKKNIYAGEPLILTVDAMESLNENIVELEYNPPEFKNFFVKSLGGEKRFRKGNITVHEMQYLLIPQKKGKLTVPPASVKIGTRNLKAPKDPFGIFKSPVEWNSIRSAPLHLTVKPLPAHTVLVGHYNIRCSADKRIVKRNKPVNYTLTISGEGSLEDFDDPEFNINNVTVYSDDAKVKSKVKDGKVYSSYVKKYVFISDRDFTIPSLNFGEFDYVESKNSILKTNPISIKVSGGSSKVLHSGQKKPLSHSNFAGIKNKAANPLEDSLYYARKEYEDRTGRLPWYVAAAFAAGMVTMFLLIKLPVGRFRRSLKNTGFGKQYSNEEALKILYPHTNEGDDIEEIVRKLYEIQCGNRFIKIDQKLLHKLIARYADADQDAGERETDKRKSIFYSIS